MDIKMMVKIKKMPIILIKFNFNSIDLPNVHTDSEVEEQLNNCVVCPPGRSRRHVPLVPMRPKFLAVGT